MKASAGIIFLISILVCPVASGGMNILPDSHFDYYGNICWEDEKSRLDSFAVALQQSPELDGYILVYAGRHSCVGEALSRAGRAKKWVVKRGVEEDRVILKDGGYREDVTTILQPIERGKDFPISLTIEPDEVEVHSHCKGKIYKPSKCVEP